MDNNRDFLLRGMIRNMRFSFAETAQVATEGIRLHDLDPVSGHLFSRALTVGVLAAPLLEGNEKYSLQWKYEGRLKSLLVDVTAEAEVRGIIGSRHLMQDIDNEQEIYGDGGKITIVKSNDVKMLNSGTAAAGLLDVADDIAFFISTSDQIETEVATAIKFRKDPQQPIANAAGFMIQAMPECDLDNFTLIRSKLREPAFRELMLNAGIPEEKRLWKLLEFLFDQDFTVLKKESGVIYEFSASPRYACNCSIDRMKQVVGMLGREDIKELLEEQQQININCEFCNTKYSFTQHDLQI